MAKSRMDLTSFVGKLLEQDDVDALREGVRILAQAVMETEVSSQIGALPYERSSERSAYRNGYRTRTWDTRVGTIELKIPKVTRGSYFPSLLEPRRRAEKALHAVVVEAYVKGVSTRKVDDLVKALGIEGISRSEVSRVCKVLDSEVEAFRSRRIDDECPYVILDATFHKVRELDRVAAVACVVAVGVTSAGERRVLGVDCGPSEDEAFWTRFLRSLVKRGLTGSGWSYPMHTRASRERSPGCSGVCNGNDAGFTSCATCCRRSPELPRRPSLLLCARSSISPTTTARWHTSATSLACCNNASPRPPICSGMRPKTSSPTCTFPRSTDAGSTRPTRSSVFTWRSSAELASSGSSPTAPASCEWWGRCCRSKTMNGRWRSAATSQSSR
jgi:hypothetical protein